MRFVKFFERSFNTAIKSYETKINDVRNRLAPSVMNMKGAIDVYKQERLDRAKLTSPIMKGVTDNVEEK